MKQKASSVLFWIKSRLSLQGLMAIPHQTIWIRNQNVDSPKRRLSKVILLTPKVRSSTSTTKDPSILSSTLLDRDVALFSPKKHPQLQDPVTVCGRSSDDLGLFHRASARVAGLAGLAQLILGAVAPAAPRRPCGPTSTAARSPGAKQRFGKEEA